MIGSCGTTASASPCPAALGADASPPIWRSPLLTAGSPAGKTRSSPPSRPPAVPPTAAVPAQPPP
jgi:hypothetical protein